MPLSLLNGKIVIHQGGSNVVLQTDFGLELLYDTVYHVKLQVPYTYRAIMGGLCGNFNGNPNDDFQLPNARVTKKAKDFGQAWKVNASYEECDGGCEDAECFKGLTEKMKLYMAKDSCGMITDPKGPFQPCHSVIRAELYFKFCIFDAALLEGKDGILCISLQAYTSACNHAGVTISGWRTSSFCRKSCTNKIA